MSIDGVSRGGRDGSVVDSLPANQLNALPDAGIVDNVETYLLLKQREFSDQEIFRTIETHRATIATGAMPANCDLRQYVKYRVALENVTGNPFPESYVDYAVDQTLAFFEQ